MSIISDAIETKKHGGALDEATIASVVGGYTAGSIPDYQMAALLMAIRLKGMTYDETLALTTTMANSGVRYSFPDCVDKHSTGGVGDKVTLTALPLVAACGAPVAKLSGRGLGITGGTIDKLESIPGWSADLSEHAFRAQVERIGLVVGGAGELAPADKVIYALRDTTGTVDSLPLIGSSIVSKKAATGSGHLLYDVKAGSGAFMKTVEQARELAELLVRLSASLGISSSALVTDMDTALGRAVGNALEVRESVAFLRGDPSAPDLAEVARAFAVRLLELHGSSDPHGSVERAISSGAGYEKLREFVAAQGGDVDALTDLPVSPHRVEVLAPRDGYVGAFDALG
ncbi:MAG TPA: thymidine phosphorylase, partial [Candidatus Lustribacter sp.]|nr:thymidine phosphorylase [Candidatus Lustribacter sp.]